jgi:ABC-type Mn2+/Zn2+ transport system permease subunit
MEFAWTDHLRLFGWAIAATLCAGFTCPLVGAFLHVRRTSFYGIALPQFATAGVILGFGVLPWWIDHLGLGGLTLDEAFGDYHAALHYHLSWAAAFTFGGLGALSLASRRGGSEIVNVAIAFAITNALAILFGRLSPIGQAFVEELMHGEVLGVGVHEFETVAVVSGLVVGCIVFWRRDLVLVSFDREYARVQGLSVQAFELLLAFLTGLIVATGTMTLGPTLLFGLLVLPSAAARQLATSMRAFLILSPLLGVISSALGITASFGFDLPMGAAVVVASALTFLLCWLVPKRGRGETHSPRITRGTSGK